MACLVTENLTPIDLAYAYGKYIDVVCLILILALPRFLLQLLDRHHQHGRWQARIGRVAGNKDLYLGTFSTQEEAAEAYDIASIKFCGVNAVTNFEISRYDVKSILESSTLPIGGAVKRLRTHKMLKWL
ncbi:AP2-like ethylene-responsive transcription factor BBM1 [Forsythia ovata]|uniref:AP2-like ethylene-responsive transcription factor BBM1 n=1 Tax=Forsythia ovata TaxID=205694 RepID=A0ABD1NVX4_9LAMI